MPVEGADALACWRRLRARLVDRPYWPVIVSGVSAKRTLEILAENADNARGLSDR
jgi:hypothetical protein